MTLLGAYISRLDQVGESILTWADPHHLFRGHTEGWPLTKFSTAFNVVAAYLLLVWIGSIMIMMKGIPAMDPYAIKFVYNVSQILLCAYMTVEAVLLAYRHGYGLQSCVGYSQHQPALANLMWMFYVSKVWDFCDTSFIILGRKWRQLSFLHLYHHSSIFLVCWLDTHVFYDGDIWLTILLNAFVHTVMYTYYFVCMHTRDPKTGHSIPIWWKSSLTLLQLIQFVIMMGQGINGVISQCPSVSQPVTGFYIFYILSIFLLFAQFYVQNYMVVPTSKKVKSVETTVVTCQ